MPQRTPADCSHCGGGAKVRHGCCGDGYRKAYVECRHCWCRGPLIRFSDDPSGKPHIEAERLAIEQWNKVHAKQGRR